MDPQYGHDESMTAAADLMVSPDLGGELLPAEKAEEAKAEQPPVEAAEPEVEPDTPETEDEDDDQPLAAEAPESEDGGSDVEIDEPDAQEGTSERFKVKIDGEETEVTLDELKQGYSGQQYVQKGMQEAAAARKEAEAIYNSLQDERRKVAQFIQQAQQGIRPPPVEPDKALFESDPISYMEQKIKFDEEVVEFNQQMGQLQQVAAQQSEADKQAMQTYLQGELKQLQATRPDFRTPEGAEKARERLVTKGQEYYGYSPEEIGQITDHRAISVLDDAIAYRKLKDGKGVTQEQVKAKVTPVGNKSKRVSTSKSRRRKQKDQLKKTGSIDDALDMLFQ